MMDEKDYGVRVIRAYSQFSVGRVLFPDAMLRKALIDANFVERIEPPPEPRMSRKTRATLPESTTPPE